VVRAEARDYSWRGNRASIDVSLRIDTVPPAVTVLTGLTYVRRGGTELAVYRVGEAVERHGVQVGEELFPGYPHPSAPEQFVAFYAMGPDADSDSNPEVVAIDRAGNQTTVPLSISIVERRFPDDTVRLTDGFMSQKVNELLPEHDGELLDGYLRVNRDLRRRDGERIGELCSSSSKDRLWTGPFLQLPGSKVNARFGERRTYLYNGKQVDRQLHLGFDLASTARAAVPASNDGVVLFAGPLGLYGNTVIVDHGLGVFTLYGHLSEIGVEKGQAVARGEPIGRTGATGLAGGDHLHFSVIVSGAFVDPLEWFDGRWIREHVEAKLAEAPAPQS
jgi:murein DD-endopeptidase MepM/ murein hydrolase activator NlpD